MQFEPEFLMFEPTPKGIVEYKNFKNGFYLYGPPHEVTTSQGSGSGGSVNTLHFAVKATRKQFAMLGALALQNSKATKKITHTSCYKIDNDYKETARNIYEEITFVTTDGQHVGAEKFQRLIVVVSFTKKDSKTIDYGDDGKALPSFMTKINLREGTVTSG